MEVFDAVTIFASGLSLGTILGHWLGRADVELAYARGHLDGVNLWWAAAVKCGFSALRKHSGTAGDAKAGGDGGA